MWRANLGWLLHLSKFELNLVKTDIFVVKNLDFYLLNIYHLYLLSLTHVYFLGDFLGFPRVILSLLRIRLYLLLTTFVSRRVSSLFSSFLSLGSDSLSLSRYDSSFLSFDGLVLSRLFSVRTPTIRLLPLVFLFCLSLHLSLHYFLRWRLLRFLPCLLLLLLLFNLLITLITFITLRVFWPNRLLILVTWAFLLFICLLLFFRLRLLYYNFSFRLLRRWVAWDNFFRASFIRGF